MTENLKGKLQSLAKNGGAKFFGVADLAPARDFITGQGGEFLARYPVAVSIGYQVVNGIVDDVQRHDDAMAVTTYRYHIYEVVNRRLDDIILDIAREVESAGYRATIVPPTLRVDNVRHTGIFSHKLAAHLAGIGWIGKSALLVTPECGTRVRLGTVLTDAPLPADQPFVGEKCGSCSVCIETCPAKAYTGAAFDTVRPRSELFDAQKCYDYLQSRTKVVGCASCGLCVSVCPRGRKKGKSSTDSDFPR